MRNSLRILESIYAKTENFKIGDVVTIKFGFLIGDDDTIDDIYTILDIPSENEVYLLSNNFTYSIFDKNLISKTTECFPADILQRHILEQNNFNIGDFVQYIGPSNNIQSINKKLFFEIENINDDVLYLKNQIIGPFSKKVYYKKCTENEIVGYNKIPKYRTKVFDVGTIYKLKSGKDIIVLKKIQYDSNTDREIITVGEVGNNIDKFIVYTIFNITLSQLI